MPDAMKLIRAELGSDAVILNSKVVQKGGFLGFFMKKNIEVIAAIDPLPSKEKTPLIKEKSNKFTHQEKQKMSAPIMDFIGKNEETNHENLLKEIKDLRSLMVEISSGVSSNFEKYPEPLKEINQLLVHQEIGDSIRHEVITSLLEKWYVNKASATSQDVTIWLKEQLTDKLSSNEYGGISYKRKFINVVGPTGVGKTTTLAKIAAECLLTDNKKVAFITTDTYRIAAIDQLKTYAKILGIPLEVSYNLDDFKAAKEKFNDYDVVLIDTAGRNFRNKQYVDDLRNVIDFNEEMETFLVLGLTSKLSDMKEIYEQFSLVKINKVIFTKVDETSIYGHMINFLTQYGLGVAYLTNGQNVPDDIIKANPQAIVNTLLGDE